MDANTPIIGPFVCKVAKLAADSELKASGDESWWTRSFEQDVQFPNEDSTGWMCAEVAHSIPEFEEKEYSRWLDEVDTLEDMLKIPLFMPEPVQVSLPQATVAVGNQMHYGASPAQPATSQVASSSKTTPSSTAKPAAAANPKNKNTVNTTAKQQPSSKSKGAPTAGQAKTPSRGGKRGRGTRRATRGKGPAKPARTNPRGRGRGRGRGRQPRGRGRGKGRSGQYAAKAKPSP